MAIPVKLYSTVDTTRAVRFNYLSKDGSRLKQQYIRASDGEVVEREDRVQGYEFAKGQCVTFYRRRDQSDARRIRQRHRHRRVRAAGPG